jgi:hypothetical protein
MAAAATQLAVGQATEDQQTDPYAEQYGAPTDWLPPQMDREAPPEEDVDDLMGMLGIA